MTVAECLDELCGLCQISKRTRIILEALVHTETERILAILAVETKRAQKNCQGRVAAALRDCRDEILRTSPGKGGATDVPNPRS